MTELPAPPRIDEALVRSLLADQFPAWAGLPVRAVRPGGNDHRAFRLGDALAVRLPSAPGYVPQVAKEQAWLPRLAQSVPLPIPRVVGHGLPSERFPAPWSVLEWLEGEPASAARIDDDSRFAADVAGFLVALRGADTAGAPPPGPHSAFRGAPVAHWDDEVRDLLARVDGHERDRAAGIWRDALAAAAPFAAAWFHGDVALDNLLVRDGRLAAVIDFGCAGVGDTACDTVLLWTRLEGAAADVYRRELALDEATWARGRGWALWKALILLGNRPAAQVALGRRTLRALLDAR
ncbi:aminoglycoside phosphotransferase family protein [Agrococcus sp. HG114]|uniref:aminoglycoside phosphotransferase family protein n=1 Tax=Agrococcus sp. HG114 TaxID=2969757 RepID=UPI00215A9993|nr:aminoglycoside phosphotransferase family protein [Agrococcus sp. HG114]MCR8669699.1 aminoglycoside phosphotransferase family protein [Agrococcus sp. HG114]